MPRLKRSTAISRQHSRSLAIGSVVLRQGNDLALRQTGDRIRRSGKAANTPRSITASISSGGLLILDLKSGRFAIQKDASYAVVAGSTLMVAPLVLAEDKERPPPLPFAQISQDDATKILLASE